MESTNMFDYITWRGDIPFESVQFGKIDGMILSRFIYCPFELAFSGRNASKNKTGMSLEKACTLMIRHKDISSKVIYDTDIELMKALKTSERFKNLKLYNFVNYIDEETETQFCCISISVTKDTSAIIYRGTDDTIIGWKEDLNLGFVNPIAAQIHALDYLTENGDKMAEKIILAGHSKGGNLASYAGAFCDKSIQDRIAGIYNYDGPGFMDSVLETDGFRNVYSRIHTYVPQTSIVGMLLGHKERHHVIHSNNFGPTQHNMYSWEVIGNEFIEEETTTKESKNFDYALKDWLLSMSPEEREEFVEGAYSIVSELEAKTLTEVKENWLKSTKVVMQSMKNMDDETKKKISDGVKIFIKSLRKSLSN